MPQKYTPEDFVAAFWAKVEKTATCWIWRGKTALSRGERRGRVWDGQDRRWRGAHQVALEMKLGRPIAEGLQTNHLCDTTLCVRNDDEGHIYEGTQQQNVADMHARGRATKARGSRDGNAKLTELQVYQIKLGLRGGERQYVLASRFGVSFQLISEIARDKIWKHVIVAT